MTTVSTAAFYERANLGLGQLRKRAETLQSQIGSGSRLARSSDDPVTAARLRELARRDALAGVDGEVSDRAATQLGMAADAVSAMTSVVARARELAMQAAGGTLSADHRAAIGEELGALAASLVGLANTRDAVGNALFGGQTPGAAYAATATGATYLGTGAAPQLDLGEGQSVAAGITGPELFEFTSGGTPTDLFTTIGTLAAALKAGDPAGASLAAGALDAMDTGFGKLTTAQTVIGTRLAWIDTMAERRTDRGEFSADEQASIGGADLALTISKLQETMTVLEASQASFVKLANLSLFDILR